MDVNANAKTDSSPTPAFQSADKQAVRILNEFLERDPEGCQKFLEVRVNVNADMVKSSGLTINGTDEKPKVGFLAVLNGALVASGLKKVVTIRDEADAVQGFCAGK